MTAATAAAQTTRTSNIGEHHAALRKGMKEAQAAIDKLIPPEHPESPSPSA
jgi:hypothetical protein